MQKDRNLKEEFGYLIGKIEQADFKQEPFTHIKIEDFLSDEHLSAVLNSHQISLRKFKDDRDLVEGLRDAGYEAVPFPGTTESVQQYLKWHNNGDAAHSNSEQCEGFGMTFRLEEPRDQIVQELNHFFNSKEFISCVASKFGIDESKVYKETGFQKYLDGYEISPHPDTRLKALTLMLNINPHEGSEDMDHHTEYMNFKDEKKYVEVFWKHNEHYDRCWVPWDWCKTVKTQNKNNSIVIFSPSDDTLHAIKVGYDHLRLQRTQFYANLWYNEVDIEGSLDDAPQWEEFVVKPSSEKSFVNADVIADRLDKNISRIKKGIRNPSRVLEFMKS